MAFPVEMVTVLTGATPSQLATWRRDPILLEPEVARRPRALYSFRDVMALRTMVYLRSEVPLQRIRAAFRMLEQLNLTEHPAQYTLTTDGTSVFLVEGDSITNLVDPPTQKVITNLGGVFETFRNFRDDVVVNFRHPRPLLDVSEGRLGGWPTISGTRVPYDVVADLVADGDVAPEEVPEFYPTVPPEAVADAVSFHEQVLAAAV